MTAENSLLSLLKQRHEYAKRFSKDYHDRVKRELKDYMADSEWLSTFTSNNKLYMQVVKRYEIIIPLIFTQHEGMLASMFDRVPDLLINQKGKLDEEKAKKIKASYSYLKDKRSLAQFMNTAAWWFLLTGFVSASAGYVQRAKEVPVLDEEGNQLVGDDGEPLTRIEYIEDDPEINVDEPESAFFGPESKPCTDGSKISYRTCTKLMTTEEVFRTYGQVVEADATLEVPGGKKEGKKQDQDLGDLKRVNTTLYYGQIPSKYSDQLEALSIEYDYESIYFAVFTKDKILHIEKMPEGLITYRTIKWYGPPNEFYGFGLAKLLLPFQKEKSLRRTQQARYADVAAFPKLLLPNGTDIDESAAADPREVPTILYDASSGSGKPEYLSPPEMSNTLSLAEEKADRDAQQASGLVDLSQGAQSSSTVDTATGQSIFADAAEKRIRYAKKEFMEFFRQCVIMMLKLAQQNWSSEKVVSLTDDEGNTEEITLTAQDLSDINFDTDISIDPDSLTINEDVLRQQAIELYNISKDDPLVDRKQLFMNMLRVGFDSKNPEKFVKETVVPPGTILVDPQTGAKFKVDETGELVDAQTMDSLAQPTDSGVSQSPSGIMGAVQRV